MKTTFYFHIIKNWKEFSKNKLFLQEKSKTQNTKKAESILGTSLSLIKRNDFRLVELINPKKQKEKMLKEKNLKMKSLIALLTYLLWSKATLGTKWQLLRLKWEERWRKNEWFLFWASWLAGMELKYQEIYSMKFRRMGINWMKIYLTWMEVNSLIALDESCEKINFKFLKVILKVCIFGLKKFKFFKIKKFWNF